MIFIIIGNSCSGKSTVMDFAIKEYGLSQIKQCTTRKKRSSKDNEYIFLTSSEFKNKKFINIKKYNGNYYGVSKDILNETDKKNLILITDYKTAKMIKSKYKADIIYLSTPLHARIKYLLDSNIRSKKRILLDLLYFWEIFGADKIIYNDKDIPHLEHKVRDYFDSKIKHT